MKGKPIKWEDAKIGDLLTDKDEDGPYVKIGKTKAWDCFNESVMPDCPAMLTWTWHTWEEPKPKVKRWLWCDPDGSCFSSVSNVLYSEEEIKHSAFRNKWTKKLLWSETEFDV